MKVIEAFINETAKSAKSVDKYEQDVTFDGKSFYFKNKSIKSLSVEELEELIRYIDFKGIFKRWSLSEADKKKLVSEIWNGIPDNYNITILLNRGFIVHGVKSSNNLIYEDNKGQEVKLNGVTNLIINIKDGNPIILSKDKAPSNIKYSDIMNSFGKIHNFSANKSSAKVQGGREIEYDDDLVTVYQNGSVVYKGIEDYDPMKYSNWKWDSKNKYYTYKDYIKVCIG